MSYAFELLIVSLMEAGPYLVYGLAAFALFWSAGALTAQVNLNAERARSAALPMGLETVIASWMEVCRNAGGSSRKRRALLLATVALTCWLFAGIAVGRGFGVAFDGYDPGFFVESMIIVDGPWYILIGLPIALAVLLVGCAFLFCRIALRLCSAVSRLLGKRLHPVLLVAVQCAVIAPVLWVFLRPLLLIAVAAIFVSDVAAKVLSGDVGISPSFVIAMDEVLTSPLLLMTALWLAVTAVVALTRRWHPRSPMDANGAAAGWLPWRLPVVALTVVLFALLMIVFLQSLRLAPS